METANNNQTTTTPQAERKSAFALLKPKEQSADKAHRISAESQVVDGTLHLALSLEDIGNSKPSKGEKGAIGFMFNPVTFEVDGQTFQINPGWVTLSAR